MRRRNERPDLPRRGSVLAMLLPCLAVIVALLAINLDGGRMLDKRRLVQQVADASALAAANDLYRNYSLNKGKDPSGTAVAAALQMAQTNGFACDGISSSIVVNIPPASGIFQGVAGHVEVILHAAIPGSFSAFLTKGDLAINGRGVARGRSINVGVLLLAPAGIDLTETGGASLNVTGGSLFTDSSDPAAIKVSTGSLSADSFEIVGGYSAPSSAFTGPIDTGVAATPDPLAGLQPPNPALYPMQKYSGGTVTVSPGVYVGGFNVSGGNAVTLLPGIYIIDGGGINLSGPSSMSGNQVMIYNTGITQTAGAITLSGGSSMSLTPPTTGTYAGISIFQDRSVSQPITLSGSGSLSVTGTIYAPAAPVTISGSGSSQTVGATVIASTMTISGTGTFNVRRNTSTPGSPDVHLVE